MLKARRRTSALLLLACVAQFAAGTAAAGEEERVLAVPQTGPTAERFVPQHYSLREKHEVDFNGDGLVDVVMVIEPRRNKNDEAVHSDDARPLIVLFKQRDGSYRLSAIAHNVVQCSSCGGVYGDPFEGVEIRKNTLLVSHRGGSNLRWSVKRQFRFQRNDWYLIGETTAEYFASPPDAPRNIGAAPPFNLKANVVSNK